MIVHFKDLLDRPTDTILDVKKKAAKIDTSLLPVFLVPFITNLMYVSKISYLWVKRIY